MLCAAAATLAPTATAGNDDEVLVGNQAAVSGGAVTATVSDGSAIYYNPAGLDAVHDDALDLSASAFAVRIYRIDGVVRTTSGESSNFNVAEFLSVPSGVAYVRALGERASYGFGIFTTRFSDLSASSSLSNDRGTTRTDIVWSLDSSSVGIYAGPSLAYSLLPGFRLGTSVLFTYANLKRGVQFGTGDLDSATGNTTAFLSSSAKASHQSLGALMSIGAQWDVTPSLSVGAAVLSPAALLFARNRVANEIDLAVDPAPTGSGLLFAPSTVSEKGLEFEPVLPFRFRLGMAYRAGDSWIAVDGDVQTPLDNRAVGIDRDLSINGRVGGMAALTDQFGLGAGVFTDRAPNRGPTGSELALDFYGGTLGVEFRRERRLHPDEDADLLTFATTVALRYAVGVGGVETNIVDTANAAIVRAVLGENPTVTERDELVVHELALHLGSSFYF